MLTLNLKDSPNIILLIFISVHWIISAIYDLDKFFVAKMKL